MAESGRTLGAVYQSARKKLRAALANDPTATPDLDARLIIAEVTGVEVHHLISDPDRPISETESASASHAIDRRANGEPVARILGRKGFLSRAFKLNAATLVPRPETEDMVEAVLALIQQEKRMDTPLRIVDFGTGSGVILISLLCALPHAHGIGVDISWDALTIAHENAKSHGVADRFTPILSDYGAALEGTFDIIIANPPYIARDEAHFLNRETRDYDPAIALFAEDDGLSAYQTLLPWSHHHLAKGGIAAFEHGFQQQDHVCKLARRIGFGEITGCKDLAGQPRFVILR